MVLKSKSTVSKMFGSGQNWTVEPVLSVGSPFSSGPGLEWEYFCRYTLPDLWISTAIRVESAFTTDTPTPCRPPETLYAVPSNLPPACSTVSATSTPGFFSLGCRSTGKPRPLSVTETPPSASRTTSMVSQYPAIASSTALSTTSHTRWCKPRSPVEPMYIPGRLRTASRPSSTVMDSAPYSCFFSATLGHFLVPDPIGPRHGVGGRCQATGAGHSSDNPREGGGPPVEPYAPVAADARGS